MRTILVVAVLGSLLGVAGAQTPQNIAVTAVTNSADFRSGFPQKGSLASIFVTGLQGAPGVYTAKAEFPFPISNELNGVGVWINFLRAPILSIAFLDGYQQINVQVPWEGEREPLYVEVFQNGARAHYEAGQPADWSVFFSDANGYAIAQHASDYSPVTPQDPARAGEYVVVYGVNLAPVMNRPATGMPAPSQPPATSIPPGSSSEVCRMTDAVTVGSAKSYASYVGLAPGTVGVYQVNFQVPADAGVGDLPLMFVRTLTLPDWHAQCPADDRGGVVKSSLPVKLPVQ